MSWNCSLLNGCDAPQKKARESRGAEAGRQEAPSTPVPSDERLASVAEALQRKKESQQQAAKVGLQAAEYVHNNTIQLGEESCIGIYRR